MCSREVKTMDRKDILTLIEACGEMARGLKKVKAVLTRSLVSLSGQKSAEANADPEPNQPPRPLLPEKSPEQKVGGVWSCEACDYSTPHRGAFHKHQGTQKHKAMFEIASLERNQKPTAAPAAPWDVSISAKAYLLRPQVVWGLCFLQRCVEAAVGSSVRSDVFRSAWVRDESRKSGWRKISTRQFGEIFRRVDLFVQECQDLVLTSKSHEEFCKNVGKVHENKWSRRENVTKPRLTQKALRRITRENHCELPPLRGH